MNESQFGTPHLIADLSKSDSGKKLQRIPFTSNSQAPERYDEDWLQSFVMDHPQILPVAEIEPVFDRIIPVCRELPTPAGFVDNLFVTPNGGLVLCECKLWRNPQARREVVGQILDYAKDLSAWSYEDLIHAIAGAQQAAAPDGASGDPLFSRAASSHEIDEATFIDNVSRNLRLGRFLLLILGDGIREGVENIAAYLQSHSGLHFTLALVELGLFRMPDTGGYLVQPRVIARSINIERGTVRVVDGKAVIEPPSEQSLRSKSGGKRRTISQEELYEGLVRNVDPALPKMLDDFLERASEFGVTVEFGRTMILRWNPDGLHKFNLGNIYPDGHVRTDPINWMPDTLGRIDLAQEHLRDLASLVDGAFVKELEKQPSWYVRTAERDSIPVKPMLERRSQWLQAIQRYLEQLRAVLEAVE
jgi:hypothetical protein